MKQNVYNFLNQTSEDQKLFRYDTKKNDYQILKGRLTGKYILDLCEEFKDETIEMLDEIYYHENSNFNTKQKIRDIMKIIKLHY